MDRARDVLVVGGGLLSAGPVERQVAGGLPAAAVAGYLAQPSIPDTIASCRLESLLHASGTTDLPLVRGPVGTATGRAYWAAAEATGTRAAPLHLLTRTIGGDMARQVPNRLVLPGRQDHVDRVGRVDRSDLLNLGERRFGSET
ncbi:hypothetical protein I3W98_36850 [Streptomyces cavourensis]|nr:hypothetical protein [Streptomyces cavourensis]